VYKSIHDKHLQYMSILEDGLGDGEADRRERAQLSETSASRLPWAPADRDICSHSYVLT
jgi:hypothetical protein